MRKRTVATALALSLVAVLLALVPAATLAATTKTEIVASYTVNGGGSPPAPILNFVRNNEPNQTTLHTYQQTIFVDIGSKWSITEPPGANSSTERWYTSSVLSGSIFGFTTVNVVYYHQYSVNYGFSVEGGSSGAGSPIVAYSFDGRPSSTSAGGTVWVDAGSNVTYSVLTSGSTLQQRWILNSSGTGSVQGPSTFTAAYLHQDSFELSYAVHGGNLSQIPTLTGTSFGLPVTVQLGVTPSVTWLDAGTHFSVTDPLSPSNSQLRWFAAGRTSGLATAAENFTLAYYRQESFTAYYSVVNGSAPSPPTIETTAFGSEAPQYLTTTPTVYWSDVGSQYGFPGALAGSSANERWVIAQNATGSITPGVVLHVTYYHQYLLTLQYQQPAASGFVPPTLEADSLGSVGNVTLTGGGVSFWADNGTSVVTLTPSGGSQGARWGVEGGIPAVVGGPVNATVSFVYQYAFALSYSVSGGGNPVPPLLEATSSGRALVANLTAQGSTFWLDSGTPWSVQAVIPGSSPGERWATSQSYGGDVSSRTSLTVQYVLQYYVEVSAPGVGGNSSVPSGWYDAGSSVKLSFTPLPGWIFSGWEGNGTGSYSGSGTSATVQINGTVRETPLVDATLQIFTTRGGTVSYVSGTSGLHKATGGNSIVAVPAGNNVTLVAKPSSPLYSFSGWSGAGGATGPRIGLTINGITQVTAEFSLNYLAVGALVVFVAFLAACGVAIWRARKRWLPGVRSLVRSVLEVRKTKR